ncbi:hypothetical protein LWI29_004210 [Acer saccharum]|uniref:Uncharacterized protein n=1 Tax=Acer saccharum TaxID=4024 RepID=A0AA39STQ3_ACESA|nr:hypothetical protein LWI29_004210 [Acer saccharum]
MILSISRSYPLTARRSSTHPVNPSERRPPIDQSTVDPSGRSSRRDFILRIPRSQVDERGPSSSSARTDHHVPEQTPPPLRHGDRIPRRDVDLHDPVGVPITWFHRLQTNLMELEDTHIDAYLKIIRRRQRLHPTVYGSRINILDSQFFTLLDHQWDRIGTGLERKPPAGNRIGIFSANEPNELI